MDFLFKILPYIGALVILSSIVRVALASFRTTKVLATTDVAADGKPYRWKTHVIWMPGLAVFTAFMAPLGSVVMVALLGNAILLLVVGLLRLRMQEPHRRRAKRMIGLGALQVAAFGVHTYAITLVKPEWQFASFLSRRFDKANEAACKGGDGRACAMVATEAQKKGDIKKAKRLFLVGCRGELAVSTHYCEGWERLFTEEELAASAWRGHTVPMTAAALTAPALFITDVQLRRDRKDVLIKIDPTSRTPVTAFDLSGSYDFQNLLLARPKRTTNAPDLVAVRGNSAPLTRTALDELSRSLRLRPSFYRDGDRRILQDAFPSAFALDPSRADYDGYVLVSRHGSKAGIRYSVASLGPKAGESPQLAFARVAGLTILRNRPDTIWTLAASRDITRLDRIVALDKRALTIRETKPLKHPINSDAHLFDAGPVILAAAISEARFEIYPNAGARLEWSPGQTLDLFVIEPATGDVSLVPIAKTVALPANTPNSGPCQLTRTFVHEELRGFFRSMNAVFQDGTSTITMLRSGSLLHAAGIEKGDVLVSVNGWPVTRMMTEVFDAFAQPKVDIVFQRYGKRVTRSCTIQ